jgi:hypothetical protein
MVVIERQGECKEEAIMPLAVRVSFKVPAL